MCFMEPMPARPPQFSVDVLETGKMGKNLRDFDRCQFVMVRQLDHSISKTAGPVIQRLVPIRSGPKRDNL